MESDSANHTWIVVYTKPRSEKKVVEQLIKAGHEAYLPLYCIVRQWSDRKKKVELPLINSVVFVKHNFININSLYNFPLVNGILKEFGQPAPVSEQEIMNLQILTREWNGELIECTETTHFQPGDTVEVKRGDFKGVIGELISVNGKHRLVVQLKTLNVEFTVNIPKSHVKSIKPMQVA